MMSNLLLFGTHVASKIPKDWPQAKCELCLLETLPLDTKRVVGVISRTPSYNWTRSNHVTYSKTVSLPLISLRSCGILRARGLLHVLAAKPRMTARGEAAKELARSQVRFSWA